MTYKDYCKSNMFIAYKPLPFHIGAKVIVNHLGRKVLHTVVGDYMHVIRRWSALGYRIIKVKECGR